MDGNSHEEKHELEDMKLGGECFRKDSLSSTSKKDIYARWDEYYDKEVEKAWEQYPGKAGNKGKARRNYLKKINSLMRVAKFLDSMEGYL